MLRRAIGRFSRSCSAVAALEFALIYPILILVMGGAFELVREVNTARQLTNFANSAATMIASDANGSISYLDLHYAFDSAMVTFPGVLHDSFAKNTTWSQDITIAMAGISFTPTVSGCKALCTYKANVVWTGGAASRKCGSTLASASDTSTPTPTTLPSDLYTPAVSPSGGNNPPPFAIVVDVTYSWTPLVFSRLFGTITINRSAYISPRYASQVVYNKITGDDAFGAECPGY